MPYGARGLPLLDTVDVDAETHRPRGTDDRHAPLNLYVVSQQLAPAARLPLHGEGKRPKTERLERQRGEHDHHVGALVFLKEALGAYRQVDHRFGSARGT